MDNLDKIYKLYNINNQKADYIGVCTKVPCKLYNQLGLFKMPMRYGSKDHIMEAFCYNLSRIINAKVVYAEVVKTRLGIGAFTRYEIPPGYGFIHASEICNQSEMFAQDIVSFIKSMYGIRILSQLFEIIQFDFLAGQLDRHLQNIAFLTRKSKVVKLYKMYDNGICLQAHQSEDNAVHFLSNTYFSGRMGDTDDLIEAMRMCIDYGAKSTLNISNINHSIVYKLLEHSDKYKELNELRKSTMTEFVLRQKYVLERGGLV